MFEKIPISDITNEEWLQLRKTGIGGSDAGAVCGVNPYSSAIKVFRDKTIDTTNNSYSETNNEAIRIGHDLEQYVASRFSEVTGLKVRRSNYMYRSTEHPFMIADVDRLVVGEDAGLECKTVSAYNADKWADGKTPLHYVMQCYHYMVVTGRKTWYIAAVILGKEFVYRKLEWDDEVISSLIDTEEHFWNNHILTRIMPSPDGSSACDEAISEYFNKAKKSTSIELVGFDDKLNRRENILRQISALQDEQKKIEQEIKLYMRDNEYAYSNNFNISWCNIDSVRLDTKRIKAEEPAIYSKYAKPSHCRRFEIKEAANNEYKFNQTA